MGSSGAIMPRVSRSLLIRPQVGGHDAHIILPPPTLAAVMRNGLVEMKNFGLEFFKDVKAATFLEEYAGVADLMTSCMGGRNRKVAEAFARTGKSFDELEKELLGGQSESRGGSSVIRRKGSAN